MGLLTGGVDFLISFKVFPLFNSFSLYGTIAPHNIFLSSTANSCIQLFHTSSTVPNDISWHWHLCIENLVSVS